MNLAELSKEQKQYIVLGLLAVVVMAGLLIFGVRLVLSSSSEVKEELDELTRKIETSDRTLAKQALTNREYEDTMATLKQLLEKTPPVRNYYSWATEIIYAEARGAGLEVDAVDEIKAGVSGNEKKKPAENMALESYALRVTAHGGYENVKRFLRELQHDHPLVRFVGVELNKGREPEIHDIQFSIDWPFNLNELTTIWQSIEEKKIKMGVRKPVRDAMESDPVGVAKIEEEPVAAPLEKTELPAAPVVLAQTNAPVHSERPQPAVHTNLPAPVSAIETADSTPVNSSANKLESLLQNQSKKDETTWNDFMSTLDGGGNEKH